MAFASGNPALSVLDRVEQGGGGQPSYEAAAASTMTIQGTVNKLFIMLGIALVTATIAWSQAAANPQLLMGLWIGGAIGGLILALITCFKPHVAHVTAPIYAAFEGLFLGAISVWAQTLVGPNVPIVMQAAGLTFGTMLTMLVCYKTGIIKPTEKFKAFMSAAIGAVLLFYIVSIVMGLFGVHIRGIHTGGPLAIGITLFIIGIAALSLILDFDFIVKGEAAGLPRKMEWFAAFGLMVTLVWLYIEFLRLLIILYASRE